jgi:hypothetical protein
LTVGSDRSGKEEIWGMEYCWRELGSFPVLAAVVGCEIVTSSLCLMQMIFQRVLNWDLSFSIVLV